MINALNHVFLTNIITYWQQNRYVRFAIYTDWFTLMISEILVFLLRRTFIADAKNIGSVFSLK